MSQRSYLSMVLAALWTAALFGQTAPSVGPNHNMICAHGTDFKKCDPTLGKQNEPSLSVSTRNSSTLMAGVNDYRGAGLPGGDAFVGVLFSFDGGQSWRGGLHPGCPEVGLCAPEPALAGFTAAADPTVRCGPNGLCFFSGIAFNRGNNAQGAVFASRWIDDNNPVKVGDNTFRYLGTKIIDSNTSGQFQDKPWIAVDKYRAPGGVASVPASATAGPQQFAYGNVYLVYSTFLGSDNSSQIKLAVSTDGGETWSKPVKVSESSGRVQGSQVAVDPVSGMVVISWRQLKTPSQPDAIMAVASSDKGRTFTTPIQVAAIDPFDQGTSAVSMRITSFPSMAFSVDAAGKSRAHIAWANRNAAGDARIVMSTALASSPGSWSAPVAVDSPAGRRGHQFYPSMSFANGVLAVMYYDSLDDSTIGRLVCPGGAAACSSADLFEIRVPVGDLPSSPGKVFNRFLADCVPTDQGACTAAALARRHTLDVRVATANINDPVFPSFVSAKVSQFAFGTSSSPTQGAQVLEQRRFNAANLALFENNQRAFLGDYTDLAALAFVPQAGGSWAFNTGTANNSSPVFYGSWASNHGVVPAFPFAGGICTLGANNQDTYVAKITPGLALAARRNFRPLGTAPSGQLVKRGYPIVVQNLTKQQRTFLLAILTADAGVTASFSQSDPTVKTLPVTIPARSSVSRTVFATSASLTPMIVVTVNETDGLGTLSASLTLNGDATNPVSAADLGADSESLTLGSAGVAAPDQSNLVNVNPNLNLDLANTDLANLDLANTDLANTDLANTDLANFSPSLDLANLNVVNTDLANTDLANLDLANASMQDVSVQTANGGVTDLGTNVNLLEKTATQCAPTGSLKCQLIITRPTVQPVITSACTLKQQLVNNLVANIPNPLFLTSTDGGASAGLQQINIGGDAKNPTMTAGAGERLTLTLRMVDPNRSGTGSHFCPPGVTLPTCVDPANAVKQVPVGQRAPDGVIVVPLVATTLALPNAIFKQDYTVTLKAIGVAGAAVWNVMSGALPEGMTLSAAGVLSGKPDATGVYTFTVMVTSGGQKDKVTLNLTVTKTNGSF